MRVTLELRTGEGTRRYQESDFPLAVGGSDADVEIPGRPVGQSDRAISGSPRARFFLQPIAGGRGVVVCNGGPVTTSQWLRDGDVLRVGDAELDVLLGRERSRSSRSRHLRVRRQAPSPRQSS